MQEQYDDLTKILIGALQPDAKIRIPAEQEITKLTSNNYGLFLLELSKKQASEKEPKEVRQLSATLIKNIINTSQPTWLNLDLNLKEQIKNNILSTLISSDIDIKKSAGIIIAGICKVELPNNQWNNIFDVLINASKNNNIDVKITSLITLGYIYEEISINNINNDTIINLTNMYYSILCSNDENEKNNIPLIINCLISIKSFVPFIESVISNENSRLTFLNMIKTYMMNNDENIRAHSIVIFSNLIGCYYRFFQNYMDTLIEVLLQIIDKDTEANKKHSLEVIYTIGEIETNLVNSPYNVTSNFYFLNKHKEKLSEYLLKFILTDKYNEDGYTLSKYCCFVINVMCKCCDFNFTEVMINYYNKNISSENPIFKFAALNVFRAILDTKQKTKIFNIVNISLPMLSTILLEKNTLLSVRILISHIMKSIVANFGFLIIKDETLFDKFMNLFLNLLNDAQPKIILIILKCVNEIIKKIKTHEFLPTNLLSQYSKSYFDILLNLAQNIKLFDPDNNIPMSALYTLGNYGQHAANDIKNICCNVFSSIVDMFVSTLNKDAFANDQMRLNYQDYICTCLYSFLMNKKAQEKDVRNLFNYVIQSFQQRQEVYGEGISLVGVISSFLHKGFMTEMGTFSTYLLHGLSLTNSLEICKASLMCLSEIIISTENDFNIYVGEYLKVVMNILSDNKIDRDLKPKCLNIISDLFLYCKQEVFKSFDDIMRMVGGAFEACQMDYTNEKDNLDLINYIVNLKENVLETMACIFSAVQDMEKTQDFIPYAKSTVEFINIILRDDANLSNEIIKSSIGIIADFCKVYGKNIRPILNASLLKDIIERFNSNKENLEDEQIRDFILWAQNCITTVVISN